MTDSFVTQCPHCQTSFRVTHHQLSVARGVVRCGQCLQVFNAAKQLLEQNRVATAETAPAQPELATPVEAPAPAGPAPSQDDWQASAQAFDEIDLDQALANLERRDRASEGQSEARSDALQAVREVHDPDEDVGRPFGNATDEPLSEPSALVLEPPLIEAEALEQEPFEQQAFEPEPSPRERTEPSIGLVLDPDDQPSRQQPTLGAPLTAAEALSRESLAADDDHDTVVSGLSALDDGRRKENLSALDAHDEELEQPLDERIEPGLNSRANRRKEPLIDVVDDPLHLDWQKPQVNWGKRLLWGTLTLLAAGLLAFQYVWFHFDEMARQDQYRPWFQQLCPTLGCKVPTRVDIARIKSSNLVVRSHPDFKGALIVDAIIYNRAPFAQPFPLLELRFADLNGQSIASRRFKPSEYLSGELAGRGEMPSQTPIHIALDILDPGPKAVNYSLSFRSPE